MNGSPTFKMLTTAAVMIGHVALAGQAVSGQVVLYKDTPTAAELATVMFPDLERPRMGKTRGIRFTDKAAPEPPRAASVTYATPKAPPAAARTEAATTKVAAVAETRPTTLSDAPAQPVGSAVGFNIRFAFNSADLLPETVVYLDRMGEMLAAEGRGRPVQIVGHTDALGDEGYNLGLSERRASTVRGYLVSNWQVDPKLLTVAGLGESDPLPGVRPTDGANRRVEFHPVQ